MVGEVMDSCKERVLNAFTLRNDLARFLLAEFYGTFIMSAFTHGAVAQAVVSRSVSANFEIAIAIGVCVILSLYLAFGVSGGHLNLSISMGLAAAGLFRWSLIPLYFVAQLTGGFVGCAVTYGLYEEAFDDFDGGTRQMFGENGTAGVFASFPKPFLSILPGFFEQVFSTALFLMAANACTDRRNNAPSLTFAPIFIGLAVFGILMTWGYNSGAPLNPSLDLSGRMFLALVGYGPDVWTPGGIHWWWIPIVAPSIGSVLGSWSYVIFIRLHHPPNDPAPDTTEKKPTKPTRTENSQIENDRSILVSQINTASMDEIQLGVL